MRSAKGTFLIKESHYEFTHDLTVATDSNGQQTPSGGDSGGGTDSGIANYAQVEQYSGGDSSYSNVTSVVKNSKVTSTFLWDR